ncbi:phosphonate ABC transporter, permease protein PhnE [Aestuariirhabdus sp. Z084]|uniref:phosphonate ABC transporter, permease protein PhnE n=1 Tax=Aestuariirhabdus haliotis TaxID=2918751 RepID=UPI00201B442A|nr:phosphonate ABC transporter, permease protein PhnE [Aestuariirhabdus haliotis]MCL6417428.1 phosphonate ABC transporter, permease protein PhnE [Aestuariirhabdus haliotis]MCL6421372.1 phosphonate ABC transporter, permease protein PhnE [Aestuariirhabdus haliotis]
MTAIDHHWQRFTLPQKLSRYAVYLCVLLALLVSLRTVEVIPEFFYDAPAQMADLFRRMWPIDFAYYPMTVQGAMIETLNIATIGTLLTLPLAMPLALMNASNVVASPWVHWIARFFLVSSRSVNSLVWALLFVAIFGPGVISGVLAIAFRSVGFVGKLLGEAIEEVNMGAIEALRATGASWMSVLLKGYWPQVMPAFFSIVLFRWDINVRESAVLGLVGAGGIGVVLNDAMNLFEWQRVSMALLAIFVVVIVAEILVVNIRKRLI